jgi:hypothetical protein
MAINTIAMEESKVALGRTTAIGYPNKTTARFIGRKRVVWNEI